MADWNPSQYLKFQKQRTQPAEDLARRLETKNAKRIIDIGCGPGNSTYVLKNRFKDAYILGIDSSENMIKRAESNYKDLDFKLSSAEDIEGGWDIIFSNACLQWVKNHELLIPSFMKKLNSDGILAVQMPMNANEPLFKIIKQSADESKWDFSKVYFEKNDVLSPEEYFNILSKCSSAFDMWETVYYHNMPSHESLIEWVKGTRLRPYLEVLDDQSKEQFLSMILEQVKSAYPVTDSGEVILKFRRFFFTAVK